MFCRNCKNEMQQNAVVCVGCGVSSGSGSKFCQSCGAETNPNAEVCVKCGVRLANNPAAGESKSKVAAGVLGLFLGSLGIHRFYLGYTTIGIIQLALGLGGLATCGVTAAASGIWGLIEGIMILTGSINKDAQGRPLKD